MPGVLAVMTANDMPIFAGEALELGEEGAVNVAWASGRVMAYDKVLFQGHAVAAVAAVDKNTALEAAKRIRVTYDPLPAVPSVRDAMQPGAPVLHDDLVGNHLGELVRNTNVAAHFRHELGDPEAGFQQAATVVEREFEVSTAHQGYIEPECATALWRQDGRLQIWSTHRGPFAAREQVAAVLHIPESHIRVTPTEVGGAFGGKMAIYVEPIAAILSKKCGRPVRISMDRTSVFHATGPGAAAVMRVKMGVDRQGHLVAAEADLRYDAGAYPGSPVTAGARACFAAYRVPNARVDGYDVVTTKPKTAAYRAPGSPQVAFAVESVVDEICERIGMDPLQFRLLNASGQGDRRVDGPVWSRIGNREVQEAAQRSPHWNTPLDRDGRSGKKRGRGVATGFWTNGGLRSSVTINVNYDGTVALLEGSVDLNGTRTSIAMQAAEVLGISAEDVHPSVGDTDTVGYTDQSGGSRVTYATGMAACEAAEAVVAELKKRAGLIWELDPNEIEYRDGAFRSAADPELRMAFKELASRLRGTGGPVGATASVDLREAGGAFGTHIVDVEVDPDTGKVDILRYTAAQDVGTAIHPAYVEGQMQGGVAQGVGWALNEEYFLDGQGRMVNGTFLDYRMPTALDLPAIETIIVEVPNPLHPFGVRGVGEVPIAPPMAAVANAIHDALGVRLTTTPMKPGRILEALGAVRTASGS